MTLSSLTKLNFVRPVHAREWAARRYLLAANEGSALANYPSYLPKSKQISHAACLHLWHSNCLLYGLQSGESSSARNAGDLSERVLGSRQTT